MAKTSARVSNAREIERQLARLAVGELEGGKKLNEVMPYFSDVSFNWIGDAVQAGHDWDYIMDTVLENLSQLSVGFGLNYSKAELANDYIKRL